MKFVRIRHVVMLALIGLVLLWSYFGLGTSRAEVEVVAFSTSSDHFEGRQLSHAHVIEIKYHLPKSRSGRPSYCYLPEQEHERLKAKLSPGDRLRFRYQRESTLFHEAEDMDDALLAHLKTIE